MNKKIIFTEPEMKNEIVFQPEKDTWAIKITRDGVIFNREGYPNSTPDAFAKCFIDLLEKTYSIKFYKKEPPYDRTQYE